MIPKLAKFWPISYCVFVKYMYNGLMRIAKRAGIGILLLLILTAVCQPVAAQSSTSRWFPETRHWVKGDFLKFYNSVKDPLTVFGYPITEEFNDSTAHLTQYFQRARFDLIATDKGMVVNLAHLGKFVYEDIGAASNIVQDGPTCRSFAVTHKNVCYAFLQFFDAYHGDLFFGDPISWIESRDGHLVQYFTNVRMEWQPNLPDGHRVVLTHLGELVRDQILGDAGRESDITAGPSEDPVTSITAKAFVKSSLLATGKSETIYVIVQDQNLLPVKGADAYVEVVYPDGTKYKNVPSETTNQFGILVITLQVVPISPRQVVDLDITVNYQGLHAKAATWFRIWY